MIPMDNGWAYLPRPPVVPAAVKPKTPRADWWNRSGVHELGLAARGEGVVVGVVDTGIETAHPALRGHLACYRDWTGTSPEPLDDHGHGTAVSSLVCGADPHEADLWGAAPGASIAAAKVMDARGRGRWSWIAGGIDWCVEWGADIINISIGNPFTNPEHPISLAVQRACDRGVIVTCAAGNEAVIAGPALVPSAVTVGACSAGGKVPTWSGHGPTLDLVAWGVDVPCAAANCIGYARRYENPDNYCQVSGTSFAAPIVAGVLASLIGAGVQDPVGLLVAVADEVSGDEEAEGAGVLDAREAGERAGLLEPVRGAGCLTAILALTGCLAFGHHR